METHSTHTGVCRTLFYILMLAGISEPLKKASGQLSVGGRAAPDGPIHQLHWDQAPEIIRAVEEQTHMYSFIRGLERFSLPLCGFSAEAEKQHMNDQV